MIILSFQYIFEEVIESSLDFKFKFIVPSVEKNKPLLFKEKQDIIQLLWTILPARPKTKDRRTVLIRKVLSLKLSTWPKAWPRKLISTYLTRYPNPINSTIEKCVLIISPLLFIAL